MTYRHFHRQPDGSLAFMGEVHYTLPENHQPSCRDDRDWLLARRNADDIARLEAEREAFEDLVDRASETEA